MHSLPPKTVERIVGVLIPPACREEVLGDLYERCTSSGQYVVEALFVVPMVIMSRIRRTADSQVLLMQGFVLYVSYTGAAWLQNRAFLNENLGLPRLAGPCAIVLAGVILEDAYAMPGKTSSPLKPVRGLVLGFAGAYVMQGVLTAMHQSELALPPRIMLFGSAVCLLFASALRLLFPPVTDRPIGANGPAFWLKQAGTEPSGAHRTASGAIKRFAPFVAVALLALLTGGPSPLYHISLVALIFLFFLGFNRRG